MYFVLPEYTPPPLGGTGVRKHWSNNKEKYWVGDIILYFTTLLHFKNIFFFVKEFTALSRVCVHVQYITVQRRVTEGFLLLFNLL